MARASALRRDRRLVAVLTAVGMAAAGAGGVHWSRAEPPPPQVIVADVDPAPGRALTIGFVGDTMIGDALIPLVQSRGIAAPTAKLSGLLGADFTIANLEGPLTLSTTSPVPKRYSYAALPMSASQLRAIGVDAVGLANNHVFDRGLDGLTDTRRFARQAGLLTFGAGVNRADAERPLLIRSAGHTVAVVGFVEDFGVAGRSTQTEPGALTLSVDRIARGIALARAAKADRVIAYVHWGNNYQQVDDLQRQWARLLVRAGYDAVIGSGAHIVQPVEVIDGAPVVFGLGNFVFGTRGRFAEFDALGHGLIATISWTAAGPGTLVLNCLVTDNRKVDFVARTCTPKEAARLFPTVHPGLVIRGATAQLAF